MPDTISTLAKRLARLERRVSRLERTRQQPAPTWRSLPLTGPTSVPDPTRSPQIRLTPFDVLELSGVIGLTADRTDDGTVLALLPEDYRPETTRTLIAPSDSRRPVHIEATPEGHLVLRTPGRSGAAVTAVGLDGLTCRLDGSKSL
ncbi:hypothetical protein RCO28_31020 [Streptomyces sp. LHD-70]|uniref:hypothetical protein n=1 Tax=Streptomyces sp. LHD-70 TaxID=3072140 RepID=UPI00280FAED3|nr:hypothetical protein [Streptomyces sp. LHD-70]MDQ8706870.1 hypothetical protein [Streptomyces sp. LHD-70]